MKWIGITGGIATGKTTVCGILKKMGYEVLNADEIAKEVVSKKTNGLKEVTERFGPEILDSFGELDRKKLGEIVFKNKNKLEELEKIIHPLVREKVQRIKNNLIEKKIKLAFYDVPLLFEKNMQKDFDKIIVIASTRENQMSRLRSRNKFSEEESLLRINSQTAIEEKVKKADFVINNNKDLESLEMATNLVLDKLLQSLKLIGDGKIK